MTGAAHARGERVPACVVETRDATVDVRIFVCELTEAAQHVPAVPGAHIDVQIAPDLVRQYSLLPSDPGQYVFAVKREPTGRGGSIWLFDKIRVGDVVHVGGPRNHFALDCTARHSVLIAGGIGVTPIYSMYRHLAHTNASWEMHYAARTHADALFLDEFGKHSQFRFHPDLASGAPSLALEAVVERAPSDAHFYCCGPAGMMKAFGAATKSIATHLVHVEHFAAIGAPTTRTAFKVAIKSSALVLDVAADKSILDVLLANGIDVPFSCCEGTCGACEVGIVDGIADHFDTVLTAKEKLAGKSLMVCSSRSKSDVLVLDL